MRRVLLALFAALALAGCDSPDDPARRDYRQAIERCPHGVAEASWNSRDDGPDYVVRCRP